jgi:hypothetical protein
VLYAHTTIKKERGLPSGKQSPIKHEEEIPQLLETIYLPKEVAVIHTWGHQRDQTLVSQGNNLADQRLK